MTHASNGATFTDVDRQHLYRIRYRQPTRNHRPRRRQPPRLNHGNLSRARIESGEGRNRPRSGALHSTGDGCGAIRHDVLSCAGRASLRLGRATVAALRSSPFAFSAAGSREHADHRRRGQGSGLATARRASTRAARRVSECRFGASSLNRWQHKREGERAAKLGTESPAAPSIAIARHGLHVCAVGIDTSSEVQISPGRAVCQT